MAHYPSAVIIVQVGSWDCKCKNLQQPITAAAKSPQ